MIFVDTSALYALLDRDDENHMAAQAAWNDLLNSRAVLLTTNYVVLESCALAQRRLGLDAVRTLLEELLAIIDILWIDQRLHELALAALLAARRRQLSLVDCASFALMRQAGIRRALAFDKHFAEEGVAFAGDAAL